MLSERCQKTENLKNSHQAINYEREQDSELKSSHSKSLAAYSHQNPLENMALDKKNQKKNSTPSVGFWNIQCSENVIEDPTNNATYQKLEAKSIFRNEKKKELFRNFLIF